MKINTLLGVTQTGASLTFALMGADADSVRQDAYWLHNHGIAELPEHYDERDTEVTLSSNLYRIEKLIRAERDSKALMRGGWRAVRCMRRSPDYGTKVKEGVRHFVRSIRTCCVSIRMQSIPVYAMPAKERARGTAGSY